MEEIRTDLLLKAMKSRIPKDDESDLRQYSVNTEEIIDSVDSLEACSSPIKLLEECKCSKPNIAPKRKSVS